MIRAILVAASFVVALAVVFSARPVAAQDATAKLTDAIIAFGQGDLAVAKGFLDEAQRLTSEPDLLGKIHRQRGIIFEAEGARVDGLREFMHAVYYQPQLELSEREHGAQVTRLFECAKSLIARGIKEAAVQARYPGQFDATSWTCPTDEPAPPATAAPAAPTAPPAAGTQLPRLTETAPPPVLQTPAPEEADEGGGVLSSPWFWIVTGVVVAAGATTAGVLLLGKDEPNSYAGTSGIRLEFDGS